MNSLGRYRKIPRSSEHAKMSLLIDRIRAMKHQEKTNYAYRNYIRNPLNFSISSDTSELIGWREKICHWTYNCIDHYNLHRETCAVSINLFDRFIATRGNRCDGNLALLTSITTLYIAIKVHEKKKIKLSTLAQLSRGQFGTEDIELMELEILQALAWLVHPPSVVEFITLFLKFLPPEILMPVRNDIFELSRYLAELSVCDPFFIEHTNSDVAFAAILNVLEDDVSYDCVSHSSRERFLRDLQTHLALGRGKGTVRLARDRLQTMLTTTAHDADDTEHVQNTSQSKRMDDDSLDSKGSKGRPMRFRSDSTDSTSITSRGSKGSRGSKDSKGSKGSRGRGRFLRARSGSMVTPFG